MPENVTENQLQSIDLTQLAIKCMFNNNATKQELQLLLAGIETLVERNHILEAKLKEVLPLLEAKAAKVATLKPRSKTRRK